MEERAKSSAEASNCRRETREKLLKEIHDLKQAIRRLDGEISLSRFADIPQPEVPFEATGSKSASLEKMRNVDLELERELHAFSGMHCLRFEDTFTFQFSRGRRITRERQYAVQILNENGCGKLGKWVLPMSLDVKEILSQHPLGDLSNVRPFLKSCKQHVECYACREEQYGKMKNYIVDTLNCRLEANFGYTRMTTEMLALRENDSERTYDVMLNLFYKSNETRPYKIASELTDDEELSEVLSKKLDKYFKPFLKLDLKAAFEKTIKAQATFSWKAEMRTDDIIEAELNFEENAMETTTHTRKRRRTDNEDDSNDENELTNVAENNLTDYLEENSRPVADNSQDSEECNVPEVVKKNSEKKKAPSRGKSNKNNPVKRRKMAASSRKAK